MAVGEQRTGKATISWEPASNAPKSAAQHKPQSTLYL